MKRNDVLAALARIAEGRRRWSDAQKEFNSGVEFVMKRLLHEAALNFMSVEDVATASGFTPKRVRLMMRLHGLDPRSGKKLLSRKAAESLLENSALLGIEPHEMDLTSPLAYLPAGSLLRREFLETPEVVSEALLSDFVYDERAALDEIWDPEARAHVAGTLDRLEKFMKENDL